MSRLDELIAELCPDGVPYVALSTVAEYAKERIDAAEIDADTYVGVDNLLPEKKGKTVSSYVPNEGRLISFHVGDILIGNIRPYLKKIWLADSDGGTNGDVLPIHIRDKNVEPKFLYYCLSSDQFFMYDMQHAKGAKMPRGDKAAVMEYEVPVPPLEVFQRSFQRSFQLAESSMNIIGINCWHLIRMFAGFPWEIFLILRMDFLKEKSSLEEELPSFGIPMYIITDPLRERILKHWSSVHRMNYGS